MAAERWANNATTVLSTAVLTAPAPGTTETWNLASTSLLPQTVGYVRLIVDSEIVRATTPPLSGTTVVVSRGLEGTIATHASGASVTAIVTAGGLDVLANVYNGLDLSRYASGTSNDTAGLQAAIDAAIAQERPIIWPSGLDLTITGQVAASSGATVRILGMGSFSHQRLIISPSFDWSTVDSGEGALHFPGNPSVTLSRFTINGAAANAAIPGGKSALFLGGAVNSVLEDLWVENLAQLDGSKAVHLTNPNGLRGSLRVQDCGTSGQNNGLHLEGGEQVDLLVSLARQVSGRNLYVTGWSSAITRARVTLRGLIDEPVTNGFPAVLLDPSADVPVTVSFRDMVIFGYNSSPAVIVERGQGWIFGGCDIGPYTGRTDSGGIEVRGGKIILNSTRLRRTGGGVALRVNAAATAVDAGGLEYDAVAVGGGTLRTTTWTNTTLPAFDPSQIDWMWRGRAQELSGADSSALGAWPDLDDAAYDFEQATGAAQPLLRTTSGPNSKKWVSFADGDWMATDPVAGPSGSDLSLVMVVNLTDLGVAWSVVRGFIAKTTAGGVSNSFDNWVIPGTGYHVINRGNGTAQDSQSISSNPVPTGAWALLMYVQSGSTGTWYRNNGSTGTLTTAGAVTLNPSGGYGDNASLPIRLARRADDAWQFVGGIAENCGIARALTSTERSDLASFYTTYYGLT